MACRKESLIHERTRRERTRAGLAAAASRGRRGGRKPAVTADKPLLAKALVAKGLTAREAASRLKIGKTALYEALEQKTSVSPGAKDEVHDLSRLAYKKTSLALPSSCAELPAPELPAPELGAARAISDRMDSFGR